MPLKTKILKGGDPSDKANWLECIQWTGYEKGFPIGATLPPGIRDITNLIKSVTVLDAESDDGFKVLKKKEVTPDMQIINVQLNEKSIALLVGPAGADSEDILIIDPDGGKEFTRLEWYDHHAHTDGLAMLAASRFIRDLRGPGVQIPKIPGMPPRETIKFMYDKFPNATVYGLLLAPDTTHPISKVISDHWNDIYYATSNKFVLMVFKPPTKWSNEIKEEMRQELRDEFEEIMNKWQQEEIDPATAYTFLDLFGKQKIRRTELPCLVLFTDPLDEKAVVRSLPEKPEKDLYKLLMGIFDEIVKCCDKESSKKRLECLEYSLTSPSARVKEKLGGIAKYLEEHPAKSIDTVLSFASALATHNVLPLSPMVLGALKAVKDI